MLCVSVSNAAVVCYPQFPHTLSVFICAEATVNRLDEEITPVYQPRVSWVEKQQPVERNWLASERICCTQNCDCLQHYKLLILILQMQQVHQIVDPTTERRREINKFPASRDKRFGPLQEGLLRNNQFFKIYLKYSEVSGCARIIIDFSLPKHFRRLKKFSDRVSVV
jgi:hypothetical protein